MTTSNLMKYLMVKHLKAEALGEEERKWLDKMERQYEKWQKAMMKGENGPIRGAYKVG